MPDLSLASEYARWFVNRRAHTRQSDRPHPESGRHYYYRPTGERALTADDIRRHLAGEITVGLYAIHPQTQRVKWMAIDADYKRSLDDLLKLQYELQQDGIQAALEQSRRGGHLWILFETPVLTKHARVYVHHLASKLSVQVKSAGAAGGDGIELFPKQDRVESGHFGNAIRGPLGVHRAVHRRYWFYGAKYDLESQMDYLRQLRRVTEVQLIERILGLPVAGELQGIPIPYRSAGGGQFQILDHLDAGALRRVGRNWVTQCPSCAAAGRDRARDNLAISVEEPLKYLCWAGCTNVQIRAALGARVPRRIA